MGRHEAAQAEGVALRLGEGGALVEQGIMEEIGAAFPVKVWFLVHGSDGWSGPVRALV